MEWKNPYLIQRLDKPHEDPKELLSRLSDTFSFGGGLIRGGFKKETWDMITKLFTFDYMGSSEFEWGKVPESFSEIYKKTLSYISFEMIFKGKPYQEWIRPDKRKKLVDFPAREVVVYVLCPKEFEKNVKEYLTVLRKGDYANKKIYLKESTRFKERMFPEEAWNWESDVKVKKVPIKLSSNERLKGWIDLDNHYMFFIDKEMFENTKKLFNIK
jgi:hypothetical protein